MDEDLNPEDNIEEINTKQKLRFKLSVVFILVFILVFGLLLRKIMAPKDFPIGEIVQIEKGASLRSVSQQFEEMKLIKSRTFFESFVIIFGGEKNIYTGDYIFKNKLSVIGLARRIAKGEQGIDTIKITIPEGFTNSDIANLFGKKLKNFNKEKFKIQANEGYLFPDTYFFTMSDDEDDVIKIMSDNFNKKTEEIFKNIDETKNSINEILTMASIIEKEASGESDRDLISGILWKRFKLGIALQVDAYPDTYKKRGLPDTPICNPGLLAIKAALNPEKSKYLYYLHDKDGNTHFAEDYNTHLKNITKYLK